ncbi:MAG: DUF6457 domain-containing protein [Frankiaceae bacterium]
MSTLDEWLEQVSAALGLPDRPDRDLVLDLARDVAHGVARPAAPLTAFVAGLAAGRAGGDADAVRRVVGEVSALAARWAADHGTGESAP